MNEKDKELLYQAYLEGIKKVTKTAPMDIEDRKLFLPEDAEFSFPEPKQYPEQLPGRIIMLENNDYLICCIIINEREKDWYLAYKLSPYTVFASEFDILFATDNGKYILETDNYFYITEQEIEEAIELDFIERKNLEKLKLELKKEHPSNKNRNTDLESPENKFRIMEHNITLELRCRQSNPLIWIPQIELQYKRKPEDTLQLAAADKHTAQFALGIISPDMKKLNDYAYFAENYTLQKDECHNLLLLPDENLIDKKAEIRCGNIIVFKGKLPKQIVLANFVPFFPKQAQDLLDIKLKVL